MSPPCSPTSVAPSFHERTSPPNELQRSKRLLADDSTHQGLVDLEDLEATEARKRRPFDELPRKNMILAHWVVWGGNCGASVGPRNEIFCLVSGVHKLSCSMHCLRRSVLSAACSAVPKEEFKLNGLDTIGGSGAGCLILTRSAVFSNMLERNVQQSWC